MSFFQPKSKKESTGYFIPGPGGFRELLDPPANPSFNDISNLLGYHTDQVHMYLGDFDPEADIQAVGFEILSDNIAFVSTKTSVVNLSPSQVKKYTSNFRKEEEFDDVTVAGFLTEGIKNGSLTVDFLSKVLNLSDTQPNGIFNAVELGLYLYFNNGVLTDFQSSDGLNSWAKHFKQLNPDLMGRYEKVARKYWGQDIAKIISEVNIQATAIADTPNTVNNPFAGLHEAEQGTINFKMLMVCHYDQKISLKEFLQVNHGRYKHLPTQVEIGVEKFTAGKFLYEFSENGGLINKYQIN